MLFVCKDDTRYPFSVMWCFCWWGVRKLITTLASTYVNIILNVVRQFRLKARHTFIHPKQWSCISMVILVVRTPGKCCLLHMIKTKNDM